MPFKALAPELIPLVHHIELAKAGWSLRLTEQLVTAAACSSGQTTSAADLRFSIEKQYGVRTTEADVRRAVGALASKCRRLAFGGPRRVGRRWRRALRPP